MESEIKMAINRMLASLEVAVENEVRRRVIMAISTIRTATPIPMAQPVAAPQPTPAPQPMPVNKSNPRASRYRGVAIQPQPCPVTGIPNKHRRFSYLMPEVRTAENLRRFRRS